MKPTTLILLTLLMSLKVFSQTDTKIHTLYKGENGSTTVTVFKEKVDSLTKKKSYSSVRGDIDSEDLSFPLNIGVFRKRVNLITSKTRVDTIYFSNYLSEKPSRSLEKEEEKVTIIKIDSSNSYKHYLVYDINDYFGRRDIPKDSIILDGYFKIIDKLKPPFSEATIKPCPLYYFYQRTEKNYTYPGIGEVGKDVSYPRDKRNKQNSEGLFVSGFKSGKWTVFASSKIEEHYTKGIRDGLYTVFGKKDKILYQTTFKNGTGIEKMYYSNDSLYHIRHFKSGVVDYTKPYKVYHSNGKLKALHDYPNNRINTYYKNGVLSGEHEIRIIGNQTIGYQIEYEGVHKGYSYEEPEALRELGYYSNNTLLYKVIYNYKGKMVEYHKDNGNTIQYYFKEKLWRIKSKNTNQYFKNGKLIKKE